MGALQTLPVSIRRALAARDALRLVGFASEQIFVVAELVIRDIAPPPPGFTSVAVVLALALDPERPDFLMVMGAVRRDWWNAGGRDRMKSASLASTVDDRLAELRRFMPTHDIRRTILAIQKRGIAVPKLTTYH